MQLWDDELTDEQRDALIDKAAHEIKKRKLEAPAIIMLGVHRPFANINAQMAMTFSPFMIAILGFNAVNDFSRLFSKSENIELLIQRIEREPQQKLDSK